MIFMLNGGKKIKPEIIISLLKDDFFLSDSEDLSRQGKKKQIHLHMLFLIINCLPSPANLLKNNTKSH